MNVIEVSLSEAGTGFSCPTCGARVPAGAQLCPVCAQPFMVVRNRLAELEEEFNQFGALPLGPVNKPS